MTHVRTIARTALALALLSGTAALAQTAETAAASTVATSNTLTLTAGSTISLSPSAAGSLATVSDSSTVLSFATNDGVSHAITVVATTWGFSPAVALTDANTYPVLTFVRAFDATAGTAVATPVALVSGGNVAASATNVLTELVSVSGTAKVEISAAYAQTVVAGVYSTTLTYTLVTP